MSETTQVERVRSARPEDVIAALLSCGEWSFAGGPEGLFLSVAFGAATTHNINLDALEPVDPEDEEAGFTDRSAGRVLADALRITGAL